MFKFLNGAKYVAALAIGLALTMPMRAEADPITLNVNGTIDNTNYFGVFNIDVTNGIATSGNGTLSIFGFMNAPVVLITEQTPGNINNPDTPGYPVGFRANDGTDIFGTDQRYPLTVGGLLFNVGTSVPAFGQFPLFNLYDDNGTLKSLFTGVVDGTEHYAVFGSANVTVMAAPGPAAGTGLISLLGLASAWLMIRRRKALAA